MDAVNGVNNAKNSIGDPNSSADLQSINTDTFLKLMIAQLQNQDPLDPTDNKDLLQQVNEIRSIGATDKLTETLNSVLLGQNLTSATSLIGKLIQAANDKNEEVTGVVSFVSIADGVPKLHVNDSVVSLSNVINVANVVPAEE